MAQALWFAWSVEKSRKLHLLRQSQPALKGMGEPLHNLEAVVRAIAILCHPQGLQFSPNKVTVSTVGLVPEIRALVPACPAQLAVSLHATTDKVRDWIAPVNRR